MKEKIYDYPSVLTRDTVIQYLLDIGFRQYRPRTTSWKSALIASNDSQTIYFLIGKRSIDFKLYDYLNKTKIDKEGKLYTNDGRMVRNNYYESDIYIHKLILEIAFLFINNEVMPESFMTGQGKTLQERQAAHTANLEKLTSSKKRRDDMLALYDLTAHDDGEDAYLGGGMWISSDGSLSDRGR